MLGVRVCFRALTQHGEDEVLGRVDLQSPLVVVLPLVVLAELLDEPVQVLHTGRRPEVELGPDAAAVRQPAGGHGGAVPEAARRASPTGESRGRHLSSAVTHWFTTADTAAAGLFRAEPSRDRPRQQQPPETAISLPLPTTFKINVLVSSEGRLHCFY